jgi:isopentenyl-diphosphate delta-isomerase
MLMDKRSTEKRKSEHIKLCLSDKVGYYKSNGFDKYEFEHCATTEVDIKTIDLESNFFSKRISFPFIISCMTGGTKEANDINQKLAIAANELNIPIGVGSQRQALESNNYHDSFRIIRQNAGSVPVLGNLGAAQLVQSSKVIDDVKFLIDLIEADVFVIHLNPLQELLQPEGEPNFNGLLKKLEKLTKSISTPVIMKEVGSGISKKSAKKLLEAGVKGIDVAGAGGTSWAAVELLRNKVTNDFFREWGLPTSYCVRTVSELKKKYDFSLVASGGINSGIDIAKSIPLGADLAASARIILNELIKNDSAGVVNLITGWFEDVKKIMYLTGVNNLKGLKKVKLLKSEELH